MSATPRHAVVNKLTLGKPIDASLLARVREELEPRMREHAEFVELRIVVVSDTEAILLVFFTTREGLDRISKEVAAPWFAEHVRPYLAGPVQRSVGEIVHP
jgi:hypothetical protein